MLHKFNVYVDDLTCSQRKFQVAVISDICCELLEINQILGQELQLLLLSSIYVFYCWIFLSLMVDFF